MPTVVLKRDDRQSKASLVAVGTRHSALNLDNTAWYGLMAYRQQDDPRISEIDSSGRAISS